MTQLALWRKAVFVDWHGVLSRETFWNSIRRRPSHPLGHLLEGRFNDLLDGETMLEWMRGARTAESIVADLRLQLDRRYRPDFLLRRLRDDCSRMQSDPEVLDVLLPLAVRTLLVIATDNTDCFEEAFWHSRRRRPVDRSGLATWARISNDLLCSSSLGTLKSEAPESFFGPWLSRHSLSFADALLIDDRADNCDAFVAAGGRSIRWRLGVDSIDELVAQVDQWMSRQSPHDLVA